jgi:two-component system chemotaxis sensor kinase CheA
MELRSRKADPGLIGIVNSWRFEPAEKRLALLCEHVERLALRIGKHNVDVRAEPTRLRLPQKRWAPFWSAFSHMIRNCVDHGVDSPEERASLGKSERSTISLAITRTEHHVVVSIGDDGRGIDWPAIARRAKSLNLPHGTQRELEEALFADGVSSRTEVTETSGRGVGLSAVRAFVDQLGGRIEILTKRGAGTTFRFVLPATTLESEAASLPPGSARSSIRVAV